jgi:2-polyprenyl-6-methoxyphenol hydroxylase-like FAD-dependent oxidoreductase
MSSEPSSFSGNSAGNVSDSYPGLSPASLDAQPEPGQHAVVVGCGIGGMAAAQVLSKYFQQVTILERDLLPDQPKFRAGKPQARHVHVLLGQGQRHLETIFPGLVAELRKQGAMKWEWGPEPRWYHYGGWRRRYPTALTTVLCSVNLIEWAMRRQVLKNPKIRVLTECTAEELLADGQRVVGVRAQHHRKGRGQKILELQGALVVDSTGRRSMAPEWLAKLGFGPIVETKVDAFWGYASRYYERPRTAPKSWRVLAIYPTPPDSPRSGYVFPLENNLWLVTVAGTNRDYPPDDDAGFLEFARGLAQPDLFEAIREAKPVSGIYGYRFAENRLRRFEQQQRFLEGFVALGDAVCQFNPIYGQGMSVAAIGAMQLDRCVRAQLHRHPNRELRGLSRTFQRGLARDLRVPWLITTSEDLRFAKADVAAKYKLSVRFLQGFVKSLIELGATDALANRTFVSVMHLVWSPLRMLHPWLLLKVLLHTLFVRRPTAVPKRSRTVTPSTVAARSPRPLSGESWPATTDSGLHASFRSSATPTFAPSALSGPLSPSTGTPSQFPLAKPAPKVSEG